MRLIPKLLFKVFGFGINKCDRTETSIALLRFTHKCPNNCKFCIDHGNIKLKEASAKQLANAAELSGKQIIAITGGEPLINPDKVLKFIEFLPNKEFYINTSLPKSSWLKKDITFKIFDHIKNIDISVHGISQEEDEYIFQTKFGYNKFEFLKEIASKYKDRLYISCVLNRSQYNSLDDIQKRIDFFKKFEIKKFYFNELTLYDDKSEYISFNEILKNSKKKQLKEPYPFGCHNDISYLFNDVEVHVKRQCFKHGGEEPYSWFSKIKDFIKIKFIQDYMLDERYIYENGEISVVRKYPIKSDLEKNNPDISFQRFSDQEIFDNTNLK